MLTVTKASIFFIFPELWSQQTDAYSNWFRHLNALQCQFCFNHFFLDSFVVRHYPPFIPPARQPSGQKVNELKRKRCSSLPSKPPQRKSVTKSLKNGYFKSHKMPAHSPNTSITGFFTNNHNEVCFFLLWEVEFENASKAYLKVFNLFKNASSHSFLSSHFK